jgi:ubiquinone/menaquinone biosynthesis C-methylase UbiE
VPRAAKRPASCPARSAACKPGPRHPHPRRHLPSQFLDVGSGCGLLTACGAYLVGRGGVAVGFDVRREALAMSRDAARRLTASNPE